MRRNCSKSAFDRTAGGRSSVRDSSRPRGPPHGGDAEHAAPGPGPRRLRLRQVLHLLHRAARSRAGAEPAGRRNRGEVRRLADDGCVEITLLGQTVNSYRDRSGGRTRRLADLLVPAARHRRASARLKFVTNYPAAHDRRPAAGGPRPAQGVALPARAGPERLERGAAADEARLHGRAVSRDARRIRATVPDAAVTSDFIVGFCGETEEDFQQTVALVREARFKNSFIFKYSPRPGTKAAELYADDVPEDVKRRRNNELLGGPERDQPGGQPAAARPHGRDSRRGPEQERAASRRRRPRQCNSSAAPSATGSSSSPAPGN